MGQIKDIDTVLYESHSPLVKDASLDDDMEIEIENQVSDLSTTEKEQATMSSKKDKDGYTTPKKLVSFVTLGNLYNTLFASIMASAKNSFASHKI